MAQENAQENQGPFKNQHRVRKDEGHQESTEDVGGREFGQVIDPLQAQMASGNEGLTDKTAGQDASKKTPKDKVA